MSPAKKKTPRPRAVSRTQKAIEADIGFARVDLGRHHRCGLPEVIFCPGKTPAQVTDIMSVMARNGQNVLATRATLSEGRAALASGIEAVNAALQAAEGGAPTGQAIDAATKYRVPLQPSIDGNTVELNTEQTAFAENAVAYQTTLSFLNGRINTLTRALKGE